MQECPRYDYDIQPMIAPLAKLMDWSAIQLVALIKPDKVYNARVEEAIQFLQSPHFISTDSQPARVEFDGSSHFRFPSPRPCDLPENNIVNGRFYRCRERWQERPVIILLHGWGDLAGYKLRFPLIARRCNRAGFDGASSSLAGPAAGKAGCPAARELWFKSRRVGMPAPVIDPIDSLREIIPTGPCNAACGCGNSPFRDYAAGRTLLPS
jgi:hypothetical protein